MLISFIQPFLSSKCQTHSKWSSVYQRPPLSSAYLVKVIQDSLERQNTQDLSQGNKVNKAVTILTTQNVVFSINKHSTDFSRSSSGVCTHHSYVSEPLQGYFNILGMCFFPSLPNIKIRKHDFILKINQDLDVCQKLKDSFPRADQVMVTEA